MASSDVIDSIMDGIMDKAIAIKNTGQMVLAFDVLEDGFRANNQLSERQIPVPLVGMFSGNRNEYMADPAGCHKRLTDLYDVGFSMKCLDMVAIDLCDDNRASELTANLIMVRNSKGPFELAPVDEIDFVSLRGGHTHQVLRLGHYQMQHADERLTRDGRVCLDKIKERNEQFYEAMAKGVVWKVFKYKHLRRKPECLDIIQGSGNVSGQLSIAEDDFQLARKVKDSWWKLSKGGKSEVNVEFLQSEVLASKPVHKDAIIQLYGFLRRFGDMPAMEMMTMCESVVKSMAGTSRHMGPEFLDALSEPCKTRQQLRSLRWGEVFAMKLHTNPKAFSQSDCKRVTHKNNSKSAEEAEAVINSVLEKVNTVLIRGNEDVRTEYKKNKLEVSKALAIMMAEIAGLVVQKKFNGAATYSNSAFHCVATIEAITKAA